jgi:Tfp pilus assembly protein PilN
MKRFNLMADERIQEDIRKTRKESSIFLTIIPIIIALGVVYFLSSVKIETVEKENPQIQKLKELKSNYTKVLEEYTNKDEMLKLVSERNRLRDDLAMVKSLSNKKSVPLDLLVAIGNNISEKLALINIVKLDNKVTLEGIAQTNESISDFMDTLTKKQVFRDIKINVSEYSDEFGPYKQRFSIVGVL